MKQPPFYRSGSIRLTLAQRLRNYFLTGIVVAGPVMVTGYLFFFVINFVDSWVKPLIPHAYLPETYLPFAIPGFGILMLILFLTLLGFLAANLVGRSLVDWGESLLARMPFVRGLYRSTKQIFETVFAQSGTSFRQVGLVEYPAPGCWSLVFFSTAPSLGIAEKLPGCACSPVAPVPLVPSGFSPNQTGEAEAADGFCEDAANVQDEKTQKDANQDQKGEPFVSVFLPCAPNPTTGFFFYLPKSRVIEVAISPDEAAKIVMSLGLLHPKE